MLKTRVTDLLGIEHPIIQGGMGLLANAGLAAAVSNAGALGVISSFGLTPQELRQEIRRTRELTDRPFGVNIALLFGGAEQEDLIKVSLEENIPVFETSGRNPGPYIKLLKERGARVIHKVPAVRFAQTAQEADVDAVIIYGQGAGGYIGTDMVSSMILVPTAVDVLDIPVIAGGEIADARGLVAATALGAHGVVMGTRFMLTQEAPIHPGAKQWLAEARETDTVVVQESLGTPARVMANQVAYQILGREARYARREELAPFLSDGFKQVKETGDPEGGAFYCGQAIGLIRDTPTVRELIDSIMKEVGDVSRRLAVIGLPLEQAETGSC